MRPPDALRDLADRFDPAVFDAPAGRARVRLTVSGVGGWDAVVNDGAIGLESPRGEPDATIEADRATWQEMAADYTDGLAAYARGALALRRNLHLAVGFLAATSGSDAAGRLRFRTVRTPKARFSIMEAGVGDPVVMLHGLGATKISFLPTIAALTPGYRTIAVDLPGFGDSGKPIGASYDPAFFARSVATLLDALELDVTHLVGHSLGGRAALEIGFRYPERLAGLVLMSPSMAWLRDRRWAPYLRLVRPELGLLQLAPRAPVESLVRRLIPGSTTPWVSGGIDEFLRSYCTPRGRAAFYAAARHVYLEDGKAPDGFWDRLRSLSPKSLFIWGRNDDLVPIAFERYVRECLPGARHVELATGHVPQLERPTETNRAIADFLGGLTSLSLPEAV
jgi:pimeloyl-ACP methyl ester carboxylesterase